MEINIGEFVRYGQKGILYFKDYIKDNYGKRAYLNSICEREIFINKKYIDSFNKYKHSKDIIDLIEYMDLLVIENPIKLYDKNIEVALFNPVRCDGFTTYEDGTECIILNLDYIVDVKDLKIKSILTHEQFEANAYKIEK